MSSEVYENLEDDFQSLYDDLSHKIHSQIPKSNGEERKKMVRDAERAAEEASVLLQEMEAELRKAPGSFQRQMVSKVRMHKRDLEQLTQALKGNSSQNQNTNPFSMDEEEDEFESIESSHRARLMAGTQSLTRTSDSLARSHRIAEETDQIGVDIIDDLGTQRESLQRTRARLHDTDSNLTRSRKILKGMALRAMTNKMILAVIIFLEVGILAGIVYWKFFS